MTGPKYQLATCTADGGADNPSTGVTQMTATTLQARATEYAKDAMEEVILDPKAYGIHNPWDSVEQWINFEMAGDAGDTFKTDEEREAIEAAMRDVATLERLNTPFEATQ